VDILHVVQGGSIRSCGRRVGRGVIAGETVLGVVLLVLAVATLRSLVVLARTDLGFTPDGLYLVSLRLPPERDPVVQNSMYRQALDAVRRNPTVEAAAGADAFFVTRPGGRFSAAPGQACCRWQVTDDFFRSFRIPIFAGREFTEADMVGKAQVAILTTRGARLVWPDLTPEQVVGQTLRLPGEEPRQVIGVVGDVRRGYAADVQPGLFLPVSNDRFRTPWLVARLPHGLGGFRMKFERDLREAVGPAARVMRVTPLAPGIDAAFVRPGWRAALFGLFALVALLVATTGLYSAAAFEATRRRYEIGVRIALGASPGAVRRAIMVFVVEPVVVGLSIGLPIAWGTTRVARVVDVGHAPGDALPFGVAALVLLATAVVAGWLPARRAGRLDPKPLLNSE
jgi:hypothetical protein